MADVTKSIKKSGGDYATVQAAVDAYSTQADTGWYKCEIQDNGEYDEWLRIQESVSSPSITHYIWVSAATANRHSGVEGTGHARLTSNITPVVIDDDYSRVDWLEIRSTATGPGSAVIEPWVAGSTSNVLISHCIIHGTCEYGIEISEANQNWRIDNCVIYDLTRHGIYVVNNGASTQSVQVAHCTIWGNGTTSSTNSGLIVISADASASTTVTLYNTIGCGTLDSESDFADSATTFNKLTPTGTVTWNGTHNLHTSDLTDIDGTDNTTNWQDASSGGATVTTTTANAVIFANLTAGSEDLTLVAATGAGSNLAVDNGTNRIGSEPDSRQDFSVDIAGVTRGTTGVDIGAFVLNVSVELEQEGFRFYADGTESGSVALASQDVDITLPNLTVTQLRILICAQNDPDSQAYTLEYKRLSDPGSEWEAV
jgi:hypothetical protein